jgi:hypothetical protein
MVISFHFVQAGGNSGRPMGSLRSRQLTIIPNSVIQTNFWDINSETGRPKEFKHLTDSLYLNKWVVHAKEPIKQPEYVLEYVGRYTHRVAISNHRLVSLEDGRVTFTYKNRKTEQIQETTIEAVEFIRRFLLHALPNGFVKIRHYGFLANRDRTKNLAKIHKLHGLPKPEKSAEKSVREMMLTLTGIDISLCPCCGKGKMQIIEEIPQYTGLCANDIIGVPN